MSAPEATFGRERVLFSEAAEHAVLGAALIDQDSVEEAVERLRPEHFGDPVVGRLWGQVARLRRAGRAITPHHLCDGLGRDDGFEEWGGRARLGTLAGVQGLHAVEDNVDTILDRAVRRGLQRLVAEVELRAEDVSRGTADEALGALESGAQELSQQTVSNERWISAAEAMDEAFARAAEWRGRIDYPFGIEELDQKTGGLNAGEVTVVAAWTGMGKSIAALQIAKACALHGLGVCYFSLEMAAPPMGMRLACDLAFDRYDPAGRIPLDRAMKGNLNADEWRRLRESRTVVDGLPLLFETRPALTMAQISAMARRQHRKWARAGIKPGPVIIDHVGLVKAATDRRGDRTSEQTDAANECLVLAKQLNCPVVPLAQLNRGAANRPDADKRPKDQDVKQSGAHVENARQLIMLFRPEHYLREAMEHETTEEKMQRLEELEKVKGHFYWLIEKQSNGPKCQVISYCDVACSAIRNGPP